MSGPSGLGVVGTLLRAASGVAPSGGLGRVAVRSDVQAPNATATAQIEQHLRTSES